MAHATVSKDIPASQDAVWKVISNPQRFEEWLTLHTKWKSEPPAELALGSKISEVLTIMGMANFLDNGATTCLIQDRQQQECAINVRVSTFHFPLQDQCAPSPTSCRSFLC